MNNLLWPHKGGGLYRIALTSAWEFTSHSIALHICEIHVPTQMPKAASTSWLHAFLKSANVPEHLVIAQDDDDHDDYDDGENDNDHDDDAQVPEDNGMGLHALLRDKYPLLSKNLNKQFMSKSVKFMVVRHPFERIISAYMDKLHSFTRVRHLEAG